VTSNPKDRIGVTDAYGLTMWFRSRLGGYLTVRFDPDIPTACVTAFGEVLIPTPNSNMTIRDRIRLRGFGLHEYGHPRWQPDIFKVMEKYPTSSGSPLGGVYNIIADVHSETLTSLEYQGDAKALSEFAVITGRDVYEKLAPQIAKNGGVFPANFEKMAGVMTACRNAEMTWNVGMRVGFDRLVNELYTPKIRASAEVIEKKFSLTHRLVDRGHQEDEWSLWELAKEIYAFVWDADPEEQIGEGKGEPEDGEGEGEPEEGSCSGGESNEDGDDSDDEASGDGSESPAKPAKEKIKVEELFFSDHYKTMKGGGNGVGLDFTNYRSRAQYTPVDPSTFKVISYNKR